MVCGGWRWVVMGDDGRPWVVVGGELVDGALQVVGLKVARKLGS